MERRISMQGRVIAKIRLPLSILLPAAPWWTVLAAAVMAIGLGSVHARPNDILQISGLFGLSLGALMVMCSPIYAVASPVQISTGGVAAYNAWDRRVLDFLPWSSVSAVEECRLFSVGYLKVRGKDLSVVWIPRGLVDSEHFRAAIREAAPIGNALRTFVDPQQVSPTG
jgi:hypothetical protein